VHTAGQRLARILGTDNGIIAVERIASNTFAGGALVVAGAEVTVVTRHHVGHCFTAHSRIARVVGADVLIVADYRLPSQALSIEAIVTVRTRIRIITVRFVGDVDAALTRARVVGTRVAIVAIRWRSRLAFPGQAIVVHRAGVTILAGSIIGQ